MDEPLSNLDAKLRVETRANIAGLRMTVELVEELGADALLHGTIDVNGLAERFVVRTDGRMPPALGEQVTVNLRDPDETHVFHPETGARLTE